MNSVEIEELFKSIDISNNGYITIKDIKDNDIMTEEVSKTSALN